MLWLNRLYNIVVSASTSLNIADKEPDLSIDNNFGAFCPLIIGDFALLDPEIVSISDGEDDIAREAFLGFCAPAADVVRYVKGFTQEVPFQLFEVSLA